MSPSRKDATSLSRCANLTVPTTPVTSGEMGLLRFLMAIAAHVSR
jgi:hypothetical protein